MQSVSVDGENAAIEQVKGTVYRLALPSKLADGDTAEISMLYTVMIPNIRNRFGYQENVFNLGNFIATAAVYGDDGWTVEPYVDIGDAFYTETASYTVTITAPEGYDVDLGKALAEKLGLDVQFVNTSFDGIFAGMGVNYDLVIAGVTINEERLQTMLFSTPYITNYQAIVVRADDDTAYTSLNDLTGKTVTMQKGTTSDDLLEDMISTGTVDATQVANESVVTSFAMVANGEVDVCLCDSTVANVYVAKNPDLKIAYVDDAEPEQFGIAIPMDNAALQEAINKAMAELEAEGFFTESDAIWFG